MARPYLPLTALRAFEAAARHQSFTRAAEELSVTQAAVSHQVKQLERRLNVVLFKRLPRGLLITREGETLLPVLQASFDQVADVLERLASGEYRDILTVAAVGTFAAGWLSPRLPAFKARHPLVEVRLSTHNNLVDLASEGLDCAIRFGDGAWQGIDAIHLFDAPLSVLCTPEIAHQLRAPSDIGNFTLLRSYRDAEWASWLAAAGLSSPRSPADSIVFDSSIAMMEAAVQGVGIALAPPRMFTRYLTSGEIVQPFAISASLGSYWLTHAKARPPTPAMLAFKGWLLEQAVDAYGANR